MEIDYKDLCPSEILSFFSSLGKYLKNVIEFKDELCVSVL